MLMLLTLTTQLIIFLQKLLYGLWNYYEENELMLEKFIALQKLQ